MAAQVASSTLGCAIPPPHPLPPFRAALPSSPRPLPSRPSPPSLALAVLRAQSKPPTRLRPFPPQASRCGRRDRRAPRPLLRHLRYAQGEEPVEGEGHRRLASKFCIAQFTAIVAGCLYPFDTVAVACRCRQRSLGRCTMARRSRSRSSATRTARAACHDTPSVPPPPPPPRRRAPPLPQPPIAPSSHGLVLPPLPWLLPCLPDLLILTPSHPSRTAVFSAASAPHYRAILFPPRFPLPSPFSSPPCPSHTPMRTLPHDPAPQTPINMPFRQGFAANVLRTLGGALVSLATTRLRIG